MWPRHQKIVVLVIKFQYWPQKQGTGLAVLRSCALAFMGNAPQLGTNLESLRAKRCLKQQSTAKHRCSKRTIFKCCHIFKCFFKDFSFQSWKPFRLFDGGHTPWYSLMRHMVKQLGLWHGQLTKSAGEIRWKRRIRTSSTFSCSSWTMAGHGSWEFTP